MIKLPEFILVGSAKCGTSFLLKYLRQHPQIFLPNTNQFYFHSHLSDFEGPYDKIYKKRIIYDFNDYKKGFLNAQNNQIIGEIATDYLYAYERSVESIKKYIGNPKIIIVLRNPIDRSFSHYKHMRSKFEEDLSFFEALDAQEERKKKRWRWAYQYGNISMYYNQVKAYLDSFSDVHIILYDDLKNNPFKTINKIYEFLKIEKKHFDNINEKVNVKHLYKNKLLFKIGYKMKIIEYKLLNKSLIGKNVLKFNELYLSLGDHEKKEVYMNYFKYDIDKLESLLNINLDKWKYS